MLRARALAVLLVVVSVPAAATEARGAPGDAPEYSPLPPPPPPSDMARTAPRIVAAPAKPQATPAPAPTAPGAAAGTTTTSSASLPAAAAEAPPRERSHPALDDERFSVSPLLGFGSNNLEIGAGLRAGAAAFAPHLWVGGTFMFHNGTSASGTIANLHYESSSSLIYFGPEVGYDFELGPVVLRPYGGIGPGLFRVSSTSGNVSASDTATKLLLWTGGTVLYGIPNTRFFVGGDARLVTVPGGPAFAMYALGGLTF